jgi:hypothetical protein
VNPDVIFDLDSMAEEVATVSSHLSTEIFDTDEALCCIDAKSLVRNIDLVSDIIVPETVKAELSSVFDSPRYKSPEATAIVVHAAKFTLGDFMLTIYTTYHSPLCCLLFSHLYHSDMKAVIEAFHWMKPMMNYSFPLRLPEHCLFPTTSSRRRFRILVQGVQETPQHHPDESWFLDLIWLSTCKCCASEITHFVSF